MISQLFNIPEWAILPTHNYLVIQKNGNTYVRSIFEELFKDSYYEINIIPEQNLMNPCWTTIREPYDRFISGFAYDIWKNGVDFDIAFSDLQSLTNGMMPTFFRPGGRVSHSISQVSYLLYQPMSFFVDIKDLTAFCDIHFGVVTDPSQWNNKVPNDFKTVVKEEIKRRNLTQRVDDLLSYEKFVYNRLINSENIWNWQNGNVLGTSL